MTNSSPNNSSLDFSIVQKSYHQFVRNILVSLIVFHCISGLLGLPILWRFFSLYFRFGLFNMSLQVLSFHLSFLTLVFLFFFCAYGYLKKLPWAWYLTFPQIFLSILLMYPTTYVLQYLGLFFLPDLQHDARNGLPQISFLTISLSIISLSLEIIKLVFFLLPATKKYFLEGVSVSKKKYYRNLSLVFFLFISVLLVLFLYKTAMLFFFAN